ncbi:hypothetical protein PMAYCL1PPCAC_05186 [Pristionchus mayeri]|uniref:Doublecortin domain-containing protein n=1 Tax=Pristionchus mayeri TaxID=1317129 RepID=A0AAN4Z9N0_9BILA|nr:hypothetical protein PMAYCL1PPCAC_05186 [Pristionchus mayeri]
MYLLEVWKLTEKLFQFEVNAAYSMQSLLEEITRKFKMRISIKKLHSISGKEIEGIVELENGKWYVAASVRHPKFVDRPYGKMRINNVTAHVRGSNKQAIKDQTQPIHIAMDPANISLAIKHANGPNGEATVDHSLDPVDPVYETIHGYCDYHIRCHSHVGEQPW